MIDTIAIVDRAEAKVRVQLVADKCLTNEDRAYVLIRARDAGEIHPDDCEELLAQILEGAE